jgi:alkanesulfonate monooxygenase SsuD/methylene tetrahydromethanopterin reductase-like flavin-dependent oxidoreductase (luciferase family)
MMLAVPDLSIGYVEPLLRPSTAEGLRTAVRLTEAARLDHKGVCDHVSFHVGAGFDGLLSAGMILALSETLETNTGVYLLPLRHPVLVARQVADLAQLAPGRFTFGVGLGGEDPHEVLVCGVDPTTRGRRMDECMHLVQELLTGKPVDHESEFFRLDGAQIAPAPTEPIPMIVGGRSDAALSRAGRLGDGWISVFVSPHRFAEALRQMEDAADAADREAPPWRNGLNIWCGVGRDADEARSYVGPAMETFYQLPYERFERYSPAGTPAELADALLPYVEAGCSIFNLMMVGAGVEAEVDACAQIREHLLAATA